MDQNINFIQVANSITTLKKLIPLLVKNGVYSEAIIRSKTGAYTPEAMQKTQIVLGIKKKGQTDLEKFYQCLVEAEEYDAAKKMNSRFQKPGMQINCNNEAVIKGSTITVTPIPNHTEAEHSVVKTMHPTSPMYPTEILQNGAQSPKRIEAAERSGVKSSHSTSQIQKQQINEKNSKSPPDVLQNGVQRIVRIEGEYNATKHTSSTLRTPEQRLKRNENITSPPANVLQNGEQKTKHAEAAERSAMKSTHSASQIQKQQINEQNSRSPPEILQNGVQRIVHIEGEYNAAKHTNSTSRTPEQRLKRNENITSPSANVPQYGDEKTKHVEASKNVCVIQAETLMDDETSEIPIYRMKSNPKGNALLIVNLKFTDNGNRDGAEKDYAMLIALFEGLGYRVHPYMNLKKQEMAKVTEWFAKAVDHKSVDSCIVAVSTHGRDDTLLGTDSLGYPREKMIAQLNNRNCPDLMGKPKLFFFQACRGASRDKGTVPGDFVDGARSSKMPSFTDMYILSSTIPQYVSWRNFKGSWFIVALVEVFAKHAWNTPLSRLYVKVDEQLEKMEARTYDRDKQVCEETRRSFRKDLFFNPGKCDIRINKIRSTNGTRV